MIYGRRWLNWINGIIIMGLGIAYFCFHHQITHDNLSAYHRYYMPYFWLAFFLWQTYRATLATVYFAMTNDCFMVRNYLRPWMNHDFDLTQIESIQISKLALGSGCTLYITPKGKEQMVYASGVLREHDWQNLILDLKKRGFDVSYVDKTF